jgi:hypothetical protein
MLKFHKCVLYSYQQSSRDTKERLILWLSVWSHIIPFYFFSIVLYHNMILNHMQKKLFTQRTDKLYFTFFQHI